MGVRTVHRYDVPHEPGEWIEVRLLSTADQRNLKAKAASAEPLPGEEKEETAGWELVAETLRTAVSGWSYTENGEPIPVTPENIADLDADTAQWVFREVMGLETADEKKAASPDSDSL